MRAVILAGGAGSRLRPYTTVLPKPLMPVGNLPIAEILVRQLSYYGVTRVTFAVGYLHQLIEAYFGDGSQWGVRVDYLRESSPLGTAGPLSQLTDFSEPLIVLNGDILTDLDFGRLYQSHLDSNNELTIASFDREAAIDFGVLGTNQDGTLFEYIEKPSYAYRVSMGVYVMSPSLLDLIPSHKRFDFPDLVKQLISRQRAVGTYHFDGIWLDIGRTEDYLAATETFERNLSRLLPTARAQLHGAPAAPSKPGQRFTFDEEGSNAI